MWSLITDKTPREYDERDYDRYKELLHETNVVYQHYNPLSKRPRASKSRKWNAIHVSIWDEFQQDYEDGDSDATISEYHSAGDQSAKEGEGILYHPIKCWHIYLLGKWSLFYCKSRLWNTFIAASIVSWYTRWWFVPSRGF